MLCSLQLRLSFLPKALWLPVFSKLSRFLGQLNETSHGCRHVFTRSFFSSSSSSLSHEALSKASKYKHVVSDQNCGLPSQQVSGAHPVAGHRKRYFRLSLNTFLSRWFYTKLESLWLRWAAFFDTDLGSFFAQTLLSVAEINRKALLVAIADWTTNSPLSV